MKKEVKRIHPTPLLDAVEGIKNAEARLIDGCISQGIFAYVAIPQEMAALTLGVPGYSGVVTDLADDELGEDGSRILVDYSFVDSLIIDLRLRFVQLAVSDLRLLRDGGEVKNSEFTNGGLMPAEISDDKLLSAEKRGYELKAFDRCRIVRHTKSSDPFDESNGPVELMIKLGDLLVDRTDVSRIRGGILAALEVEDRWGHRDEAPVVHLIYRAAQHFADKEYTFEAAKDWLQGNDLKGYFKKKSKALNYAAWLINRDSNKKSVERENTLALKKITENEMGRDYTETIASSRLSLLHLATDCWIRDKKNPDKKPYLPKGGLWEFLQSLGFTTTENTGVVKGKERNPKAKDDHVTNAKECQVEYLRQIIESNP